MSQQAVKELGPRWTRELLERCTPKEVLVVSACYGIDQVAKRMGYLNIEKFVQEKQQGKT
jgi:hypothetical protein